MLTGDYLDGVSDQIVALYTEFEDSVILDIARRLGKASFDSAAWQVQRLNESGAVYQDILKKLSALTGKSRDELIATFQEAGVKAMRFDDTIYKAAGLNPLPLNLSPAMTQVLAAGLRKTQGIMQNLTMSKAIAGQQSFIKAADLAYMQVSTGTMSYTQAIRNAVKTVAAQGLTTVDYASGRADQMDVAVRRAVLTGVSQTTGALQIARADEMGCDLVQTSAHAGARPTHQVWQGHIFSRSGTNPKFPPFVESTGYGAVDGLMGINCRHSFYPFFEGISENAYSEETVNELNNKMVVFGDKEMSMYDATQYQRNIERQIRYWKRQAGALQAAGLDNTAELTKLGDWQSRMRDFLRQTHLARQSEREQVEGLGKLRAVVSKPTSTTSLGAPVSNALKISDGESASPLREAVSVIDQVHNDGSLPEIPMRVTTAKSFNGRFVYTTNSPTQIEISNSGDHPHLTAAHEIGHFLDFSGIGNKNEFSSVADPKLDAWRDAIQNSNSYKKLKDMLVDGFIDVGGKRLSINTEYIKYLLTPEELWARSYAQYIVEKSQNSVMLNELDTIIGSENYLNQWTNDDFAPIRKAIDQLFEDIGWIKK